MKKQLAASRLEIKENLSRKVTEKLLNDFELLLRDNAELRVLTGKKDIVNKLTELSDEILVFTGNPATPFPPEIRVNLGFPFPIASRPQSELLASTLPAHYRVFFRGSRLRAAQREYLRLTLESMSPVHWEEIDGPRFREIATGVIRSNRGGALTYVDPYNNQSETLMGNSFIGLDFLDGFMTAMETLNVRIISNSAEHLRFFYRSIPKQSADFLNEFKSSDLIIIMDAVDNRWSYTIDLIETALSAKKPCFIPGRNLIVLPGDVPQIFHMREDDQLLTCTSVDDYMRLCLAPYLDHSERLQKIWPHESENIFLNPFSSTHLRDIPLELVVELCAQLIRVLDHPRIFISAGTPGSDKDSGWLTSFKQLLSQYAWAGDCVVFLPSVPSLKELGDLVHSLSIGAAITPDTSLAHLFCYMGLPHVTICRMRFWDLSSVQGVSTVFLRDRESHFPTLLWEEDLSSIRTYSKMVAEAVKCLSCHSQMTLSNSDGITLRDSQVILDRMLDKILTGTLTAEYSAECDESLKTLKRDLSSDNQNAVFCSLFDEARLLADCRGKERSHMLNRFPWSIAPWLKWLKLKKASSVNSN